MFKSSIQSVLLLCISTLALAQDELQTTVDEGLNPRSRLEEIRALDNEQPRELNVLVPTIAPEEIDRINVFQASLEAMRRAVLALPEQATPGHVLVDARTIPGVVFPQTPLVHGDAIDGSIAAASIVAKVHRDSIMHDLHDRYPQYGFRKNMGYPTPDHLDALRRHGPCPMHRRSFGPVSSSLRERAPL